MSNAEFERWKAQSPSGDIRRGQHLMNTAPDHIYTFASGDMILDCFHARSSDDPRTANFIKFADLCWDVTDENEMRLARTMIMWDQQNV